MIGIMRDGMGVGLAATQLGVLRRLLGLPGRPRRRADGAGQPRIEWLSDEGSIAEEGCLSLPRVSMDVERPLHARVSGRDAEGEPIAIEASGLEARVLQHEIDHLDGILILDRTSRDQRKGALQGAARGRQLQPLARGRGPGRGGRAARAPHRRVSRNRLPRHLRLRRHRPAAAGRLRAPPGAGRHSARPPPGARPQADRRRRPLRPPGAGDRAAAGGGRQRRAGARADRRRQADGGRRLRLRAADPRAAASEHLILNVHPSLLPRWRGAAPIERAIMAGDPRTGVCVMRLTAGLDSGPVALRAEVEIGADDGLRGALVDPGRARRRAAGRGARPRRPRAASSSASRTRRR